MDSVKRSNLFFMIAVITMTLGGILIGYLNLPTNVSIIFTQYLFLLVPVILYFKITKLPVKETMRLNKLGLKNAVMVLLISICSLLVVSLIATLSTIFFHNYLADAVSSFPSMPLVGWIGVLALTPAICEECVMRGVVLGGYKNIDIKKAAIMNGFLFGLFHMNFNQFFYAFILGIVMAYIVYITNSIFASMLMHFTINGISAVGNWWISKSGGNVAEIAKMEGINKGAVLIGQVFWAVLGTVFLILLIKKLMKMNYKNRPVIEIKEQKSKMFSIPIFVSIAIFIAYTIMLVTLGR